MYPNFNGSPPSNMNRLKTAEKLPDYDPHPLRITVTQENLDLEGDHKSSHAHNPSDVLNLNSHAQPMGRSTSNISDTASELTSTNDSHRHILSKGRFERTLNQNQTRDDNNYGVNTFTTYEDKQDELLKKRLGSNYDWMGGTTPSGGGMTSGGGGGSSTTYGNGTSVTTKGYNNGNTNNGNSYNNNNNSSSNRSGNGGLGHSNSNRNNRQYRSGTNVNNNKRTRIKPGDNGSEMNLNSSSKMNLPKPYKAGRNCGASYFFWKVESLLVTHPRLLAIWMLYLSIWPRALVLLDMVTDCLVAKQLYENDHAELFTVSCLVISFPFICVWLVSLRFVQKFANNIDIFKNYSQTRGGGNSSSSNGDYISVGNSSSTSLSSSSNNNLFGGNSSDGGMSSSTMQPMYFKIISRLCCHSHKMINFFLFLYLFPPIGCFVVSLYEAAWVFYDVYLGLKSFFKGTILIIDKDKQTTAIKQFRKVTEFFGESIPQVVFGETDMSVSLKIPFVFEIMYS